MRKFNIKVYNMDQHISRILELIHGETPREKYYNLVSMKETVKKWDKLDEEIGELCPERNWKTYKQLEYPLTAIGKVAAIAFAYMGITQEDQPPVKKEEKV